jgi:hypothetical protein
MVNEFVPVVESLVCTRGCPCGKSESVAQRVGMGRFPYLPTWKEFLAAAQAQGCSIRTYKGRVIVENPVVGIPVPLPPYHENETLTQFMTEYLCRLLKVDGFSMDLGSAPNWRPSEPEQD